MNRVKKIKISKIKSPYIIIVNHSSDRDFMIVKKALFPQKVHKVEYKLNTDMYEKIKHLTDKGRNVVLFAQVNPSLDGTGTAVDDSLASILKNLNLPVMFMSIHGSYLARPVWGKVRNSCDINTEMQILCTKKEISQIDVDCLQNKILKALNYDEYGWQKSEKIAIIGKERALGLERILYRCSSCNEEYKMVSKGDKIYCSSCGKQWVMTEYGELKSILDEDEYTRIPDWLFYERSCVCEEISKGEYEFYGKIMLEISKKGKNVLVAPAVMWHSGDGLILKYNGFGKEETLVLGGDSLYTCKVIFKEDRKKEGIGFRHGGMSYKIYPLFGENFSAVKIMLAIEEYYRISRETRAELLKHMDVLKQEIVTVDVEDIINSEETVEKECKGKIIAIEYMDDNIVTKEQARAIRSQAKNVTE